MVLTKLKENMNIIFLLVIGFVINQFITLSRELVDLSVGIIFLTTFFYFVFSFEMKLRKITPIILFILTLSQIIIGFILLKTGVEHKSTLIIDNFIHFLRQTNLYFNISAAIVLAIFYAIVINANKRAVEVMIKFQLDKKQESEEIRIVKNLMFVSIFIKHSALIGIGMVTMFLLFTPIIKTLAIATGAFFIYCLMGIMISIACYIHSTKINAHS
jgi:hypothetical protein